MSLVLGYPAAWGLARVQGTEIK